MESNRIIKNRVSTNWKLDEISISHNVIDYRENAKVVSKNEEDCVRLHFGMQGSYDFSYRQLNANYNLSGSHNNIMYTDGLEIEVHNRSKRIETFGVNFSPESFIKIGQNGNDVLKRFTDNVINKKNCILSDEWKVSNFKIQQVIDEVIHCTYQEELKNLFLLSKSIELLVLQAEQYGEQKPNQFIKLKKDKRKLVEAKELLHSRIENPPTIIELAKLIGLNEYKLKRGFKELFGTTIFGYIHKSRMTLAKKLLLGTDKSAKEIAFETGYGSPQHFSNAFKKEFGITPNSVKKTPDSAIN